MYIIFLWELLFFSQSHTAPAAKSRYSCEFKFVFIIAFVMTICRGCRQFLLRLSPSRPSEVSDSDCSFCCIQTVILLHVSESAFLSDCTNQCLKAPSALSKLLMCELQYSSHALTQKECLSLYTEKADRQPAFCLTYCIQLADNYSRKGNGKGSSLWRNRRLPNISRYFTARQPAFSVKRSSLMPSPFQFIIHYSFSGLPRKKARSLRNGL